MKSFRLIGLILIAAVVALSSCSFGLQPSWKKTEGKTTFAVDLSQAFTGSRAISSGTGYLYIRTIGGPTGDKGPVYGPYTVSTAGVFSTTDIPAGTFEYFCILYASTLLDSLTGFTDLINLPDDDFKTQAMSDTGTLEGIINGRASGHIEPNFTVLQGAINTLSATMTPMTGSLALDGSSTDTFSGLPDAGTTVTKRFIALNNVNLEGLTYDTMYCSVTGGTVSLMRLYNATGEYLSLGVPDSTATTFKTSYPGGNDFYLYVEYTGSPVLQFSLAQVGTPTGNVVLINVDLTSLIAADPDVIGKTLLCGLSIETSDSSQPVGIAIGIIPSSGVTSFYLSDPDTGAAWTYSGSGTYYMSALISMSGYYSTVSIPLTEAEMSSIMPLTGDYMTEEKGFAVPVSGTGEFPVDLDSAKFVTMTETQIFAANTASGSGDGSTPANPSSLANAFTAALALNITGDNKPAVIYLTGNATLSTQVQITSSVGLVSWGGPYTVTLGSDTGFNGSYFTMPDNTSGVGFYLRNVSISGGSVTDRQYPAFTVGFACYLQLDDGVTVKDIKTASLLPAALSAGGAVSVLGGSLNLYNSSITGCEADQGGAIYIAYGTTESPGHVYLQNASISGNSAYEGGGIYGMSSTQLDISGSTLITGNTATSSGGGVFTYGSLYAVGMDTSTTPGSPYIIGNTAPANAEYYAGSVDTVQHSLYVSQSGTGDGSSETTPTTMAVALADSNIYNVMLVSDITVDSTLTVPANRTLYVRSIDGDTIYSLLPGTSLTGPVFTVGAAAYLNLERIAVGAASGTTSLSTLISIGAQGSVNHAGEATLRNNVSSTTGGAVYTSGGNFNLSGGTIVNCSAAYGGAIYADFDTTAAYLGNVYINGGSITNCTATTAGGAVYLNGSSLTFYADTYGSGMPAIAITGCSAPTGGAIYLTQSTGGNSASINMEGTPSTSYISGCTASSGSGGAVYANGTNTTVYLMGVAMLNNTATVSGGAIYAAALANVYIYPSVAMTSVPGDGSISITGNQAASCGGLYMETGVSFTDVTPPDVYTNYIYSNTSTDGTTNGDLVGP